VAGGAFARPRLGFGTFTFFPPRHPELYLAFATHPNITGFSVARVTVVVSGVTRGHPFYNTVMRLHDLDGNVVRSDIRTYLTRSFAGIATSRPALPLLDWPSEGDIDVLVNLADVLFVFAASVVRFVGTPRQNPRARLEVMLARREGSYASPFHFLDQLYLQVLRTSVCSEQQEDEELLSATLRCVVGSIVAAQHPLSIAVHALLLDADRDDVHLMIESLSALLLHTRDEPIRIFHPSFSDFIVNSQRCDDARFLVLLDEHHLRLAHGCLVLLN
jgi:hypothetical protein